MDDTLALRKAILDILITYMEERDVEDENDERYRVDALNFLEHMKKKTNRLTRNQDNWVRSIARESEEFPCAITVNGSTRRVTMETLVKIL